MVDIPTIANFATVQIEGGRPVNRTIEYYSLDMILSVGYRVKSSRGVKFRSWANTVLKQYLLKGYAVNQRIEQLERRVALTEEKIELFVHKSLPPVEGIFFDGQIYDAFELLISQVQKAIKKIVLIDGYVDIGTLNILAKKNPGVDVIIYTFNNTRLSYRDINTFNSQYPNLTVKHMTAFHDCFLILDDTVGYHVGASLKDAGKKCFGISLIQDEQTIQDILNRL